MATQLKSEVGLDAGYCFNAQALGFVVPQRAIHSDYITQWSIRETLPYALIIETAPGIVLCIAQDCTLEHIDKELTNLGISPNTEDKRVPWVVGCQDEEFDYEVRVRRANTTRLRNHIAPTLVDLFRQDQSPRVRTVSFAAVRPMVND